MNTITIMIGGKSHTFGINEATGDIFLDDEPMRIVQVGSKESLQAVVLSCVDSSDKMNVEGRDFYRAAYGGLEPYPSLVGLSIAEDLLRKQQERQVYLQLSNSEISLRSNLPCAFEKNGLRCCAATRSALIANSSSIPGGFVLLPCCKEHTYPMYQYLLSMAGVVSAREEDSSSTI